ncbi:MAG TPA: hypothetical protein VK828_16030 [Terriglobales bacterium]|nr:hypothetical protein [Terriglobales bacterium]
MTDWKASLKAAAVGAISGTAIGLVGFLFLTSRQGHSMGGSLFLLVPFVAGFAVAIVARKPKSAVVAACLLSVVSSLILLIALGREGVLCGILAFPIIVTGLAVGAVIGFLVRKLFMRAWSQTATMGIVILIAPTAIVAGERIERPMLLRPRTEVIQTTLEVGDSPEKVWGRILAIDTVQANKPLLMYIGLPVPQRCTLQGGELAQSVRVTSTWVTSRRRLPNGTRHTTCDFLLIGRICLADTGSGLRAPNIVSSRVGQTLD